MLGRIVYVLILLAVILCGAFVLNLLVHDPGLVQIDYGNRIYELSLWEAAIVLVLFLLLALVAIVAIRLLYSTIRFILGDANAFGSFFVRRRERKGLDALAEGMLAIASGDAKAARRKAQIAQNKLMNPSLTRLLNAQAAELAGDAREAEKYYRAMMAEGDTAFVGTRGLLTQALEKGETDRALKLAQHARELKPKDVGTLETLYMLQSRSFDWTGARRTLTDQRRAGHIPKLEAQRREAGLVLAQAQDAEQLGEIEHARKLAVDAAKLDPTNVEAVTTATRLLISAGSRRAASKLVTDAWRAGPHPQLAAAFASIEPDEAPAARRRRFETLFALHPEHEETQYLRAELSIAAEDWHGARKAIESLRETEPTARSCAIMAAIARGEGEPEHVVRGWLARALAAPRGSASEFEIGHAAMLPLLVGAPEDDTVVPDDEDDSVAQAPSGEAAEPVSDAETEADGEEPRARENAA